ncbi:hypothetical protein OG252_19960 [Streptomyces sp. NBC_01352]|uniref:hypothetical protein n=1 Tax=Streptomyces sp. NBC_01352 TaxID=2903834 RepID=UPI002E342DE0|nr:hypothetical protein [Streptomyces sp. NBC_01352]
MDAEESGIFMSAQLNSPLVADLDVVLSDVPDLGACSMSELRNLADAEMDGALAHVVAQADRTPAISLGGGEGGGTGARCD